MPLGQQQKNGTLPANINSLRRSPSPKLYPAPPIPTVANSNYSKDKNYNLSTMPKLSPKNDKIKRNIEDNKANAIQFKLISTEGTVV